LLHQQFSFQSGRRQEGGPGDQIVRVNEALSFESMKVLYTYRRLGADMGSMDMAPHSNRELVTRVAGLGQRKFRFSPDAVMSVLDANRADIEWMEARLGESLSEEDGERQSHDVHDEVDLLKPDPLIVGKLLDLLGDSAPRGNTGGTPQEVAELVHALRNTYELIDAVPRDANGERIYPSSRTVEPQKRQLTVLQLLQRIERDKPALLTGCSKNDAADLLEAVFSYLKSAIILGKGDTEIASLGWFRVIQRKQPPQTVTVKRERIIYRAPIGKGRRTGG